MSGGKRADLLSKIYGCLAGSRIGSAMGAQVEGWSVERIRKEYGYLDKLLPYVHDQYEGVWDRPAGSTEDGIERQSSSVPPLPEKTGGSTRRTWLPPG